MELDKEWEKEEEDPQGGIVLKLFMTDQEVEELVDTTPQLQIRVPKKEAGRRVGEIVITGPTPEETGATDMRIGKDKAALDQGWKGDTNRSVINIFYRQP